MLKACNLQKGNIVEINGQAYQAKHIEVHTPSARGANTLYKVRFAEVVSGQKLDQTYKGNDSLEEMELDKRPVSYLYRDGEFYTFMDTENYEQYTLNEAQLESQLIWIEEGMEGITALQLNGTVIAIALPASIDMEITETAPVIKGATATNRNKPATLANGHTVLIPEYLETGAIVRVNTETGKFMSRVK